MAFREATPAGEVVAQAFTGARLVKGFNHLVAGVLDRDPEVQDGKRVEFLASDDDAAAWCGHGLSAFYTCTSSAPRSLPRKQAPPSRA